jgi:hypothetical protein
MKLEIKLVQAYVEGLMQKKPVVKFVINSYISQGTTYDKGSERTLLSDGSLTQLP